MTLQEVSEKYKVSESSLKSSFPRTQAAILKKYGVTIKKEGRGASATYIEEVLDDQRALTMYEEQTDILFINSEQLSMINWDFHVFLGIITTPMLVFRGSYVDFLKYIQAPVTETNLEELKAALEHLVARDYISYQIDKTNPSYFIAALWYQTEKDMEIGIEMVRTCKQLAEAYNKRSWVPLLKTWLGVQLMSKHQPYTVKELARATGLSEYQIRESNKILKDCDIFRTSKAYAAYQLCVGTNVDLGHEVFYDLPEEGEKRSVPVKQRKVVGNQQVT